MLVAGHAISQMPNHTPKRTISLIMEDGAVIGLTIMSMVLIMLL